MAWVWTTSARRKNFIYIGFMAHPSQSDQYIINNPSLLPNGFDVMDLSSQTRFRGPCQFIPRLSLLVQRAITNVYSTTAISDWPGKVLLSHIYVVTCKHDFDGLWCTSRYRVWLLSYYCNCCVILCSLTFIVFKMVGFGKTFQGMITGKYLVFWCIQLTWISNKYNLLYLIK